LNALDFDAEVFQMTTRDRFIGLTDEQVVKWVIYMLLRRQWPVLKDPPYVFIITKDRKFEKSSGLRRVVGRHLRELEDRVKVITFDSRRNGRKDYCKKELFDYIVVRLNRHCAELSPA